MIVYTDSPGYAERVLQPGISWDCIPAKSVTSGAREVLPHFFHAESLAVCTLDRGPLWHYLFIAETAVESQYDLLVRLAQSRTRVPHGLLCLAGAGSRMHGFRGRPWSSVTGNLHLSAFLAPHQAVERIGAGFLVLAAVSVVEALDTIAGLERQAALKWVNDILVRGKKVSGVLAHTQSQGGFVTGAILGIGLNVEVTPEVERDAFVPGAACLRDFVPEPRACNLGLAFERLTRVLERNYRLLEANGFRQLLDAYRSRSLVLNREVMIHADACEAPVTEPVTGTVMAIGDNLELYLAGRVDPVVRGRLILRE
jgi:biotin-[acetyl-CoA-carboxylase] ligase BirA-like protein